VDDGIRLRAQLQEIGPLVTLWVCVRRGHLCLFVALRRRISKLPPEV
jgi:hypothetical protein